MATQRRGLTLDIQSRIESLLLEGARPGQIRRELLDEFPWNEVPSLRTLQRMVRERRAQPGEHWTLSDECNDPAAILDLIPELAKETKGWRTYVTRGEALWFLKLSNVAPDLSKFARWYLAHEYSDRVEKGASSEELDHFLAFKPWRSIEDAQRYENAIYDRWIASPPSWLDNFIPEEFNLYLDIRIVTLGRLKGFRLFNRKES